MAISSMFFDAHNDSQGNPDRVYSAEDFSKYLAKIVSNGVFFGDLQVLPKSATQIIVKPGSAWIEGRKMESTADVTLNVGIRDPKLNHVYGVYVRLNLQARTMEIVTRDGGYTRYGYGVYGPDPVRTAEIYELRLATVYVPPTSQNISAGILDERGKAAVCGWVTGLIDTIDTNQLFDRITGEWESIKAEIVPSAAVWTRQSVSIRVPPKTIGRPPQPIKSVAISEYITDYSQLNDLVELFINGLHATATDYTLANGIVTLTVPLTTAGQELEIVCYQPRGEQA